MGFMPVSGAKLLRGWNGILSFGNKLLDEIMRRLGGCRLTCGTI